MADQTISFVLNAETARAQASVNKFGQSLDNAGKKAVAVGGSLTRGVTLPLAALGAAAIASADSIDKAMVSIRSGTGATGAGLERMGDALRNIKAPQSFGEVATVLANLNTATGIAGQGLEDLAQKTLDAARLMGVDSANLAIKLGQALQSFQRPAEDAEQVLNFLFTTAQDTGIGLDKLTTQVRTFGPVLANAGFTIEETAGLFGQLQKAGVDVTRIMPGINAALRKFADQGLNMRDAMEQSIGAIKGATSEVEALDVATKIFGAEGAARLTTAVRSGALDMDQLTAAIDKSRGSIDRANEDTLSFAESMSVLKKDVQLALEPLGRSLLDAFTKLKPHLENAITLVGNLASTFSELPAPVLLVTAGLAAVLAAAGPLIAAFGFIATGVAALAPAFAVVVKGAIAVKASLLAVTAGAAAMAAGLAAAGAVLIGITHLWAKTSAAQREAVRSQDTFMNSTERLAHVLKTKYNIEVERGAMSTEEYQEALVNAARQHGTMEIKLRAVEGAQRGVNRETQGGTIDMEKLFNAAKKATGGLSEMEKAAKKLREEQQKLREEEERLIDITDALITRWRVQKLMAGQLGQTVESLRATQGKLTTEIVNQSIAVGQLDPALLELMRAQAEAEAGQVTFKGSVKSTTEKLIEQVSTITTDLSAGIAKAIVEWEGFGKTMITVVKEMAQAIIRILIEGALNQLLTKIGLLQQGFSGVGGVGGGGLGGVLGLITGGAGGALGAAAGGGLIAGGILGGKAVGGFGGKVLGGAGIGAGIGTMILPGLGTAIGAAIGAQIGAIVGGIQAVVGKFGKGRKEADELVPVQNKLVEAFGQILDVLNAAADAGTLTSEQLDAARVSIINLRDDYFELTQQFERAGPGARETIGGLVDEILRSLDPMTSGIALQAATNDLRAVENALLQEIDFALQESQAKLAGYQTELEAINSALGIATTAELSYAESLNQATANLAAAEAAVSNTTSRIETLERQVAIDRAQAAIEAVEGTSAEATARKALQTIHRQFRNEDRAAREQELARLQGTLAQQKAAADAARLAEKDARTAAEGRRLELIDLVAVEKLQITALEQQVDIINGLNVAWDLGNVILNDRIQALIAERTALAGLVSQIQLVRDAISAPVTAPTPPPSGGFNPPEFWHGFTPGGGAPITAAFSNTIHVASGDPEEIAAAVTAANRTSLDEFGSKITQVIKVNAGGARTAISEL